MTNETRYNGWTNRETWTINLWITNDEGSQRYWEAEARTLRHAPARLADQLREEHEDTLPGLENGFASDLLTGALGRVNWDEIANSLIADLDA